MKVSVITRTKNRPIMLPRALQSVYSQKNIKYQWIVINDGGERNYIDKVISQALQLGIEAQGIHLETPQGMEAASNIAINSCDSEYIVIHDDDDTWKPNFLSQTISFLDAKTHYLGVITRTNRVFEEITGNKILVKTLEPFNPSIHSIDLAEIAIRNLFPPISFVFRRNVFNAIGGFNQSLPVLGDWDFNLRLLMKGDIGVIPEYLANYHQRLHVPEEKLAYGNTTTVGINMHFEYEAKLRNEKLREDIKNGTYGLGWLLAHGKQNKLTYHQNNLTHETLHKLMIAADAWSTIYKLSNRIGLSRIIRFFFKGI